MNQSTRDVNHYSDKYGMNPPHSEVVELAPRLEPCKVLDMGCGSGRNALYLHALGFEVVAVDSNPGAIGALHGIMERESIADLDAHVYDINEARLKGRYGLIACTVTLMFLDPARVEAVVRNMQEATVPGGCNLVVAAMSTDAHPCPVGFPFTLAEGQLSGWYEGWELLKDNENLGTLHSGAQMQFATMVARKAA